MMHVSTAMFIVGLLIGFGLDAIIHWWRKQEQLGVFTSIAITAPIVIHVARHALIFTE